MKTKTKESPAAFDFARIRYSSETELERVLEKDFALEQYYDIFDSCDEVEAITTEMLSNTVLLSQSIAPRIYNICSEIQAKLSFTGKIDFYLQAAAEINAFSINGYNYVPNIICFTSALIQQMNDDELRFVIGHEIGHLIYEHNKLDVVQRFLNKREDERLPAMITLHYLRFINYAEISADRIGFLAMPDIHVVTNTFFKLTCGLSEQHLNFDASEYLKQTRPDSRNRGGQPLFLASQSHDQDPILDALCRLRTDTPPSVKSPFPGKAGRQSFRSDGLARNEAQERKGSEKSGISGRGGIVYGHLR